MTKLTARECLCLKWAAAGKTSYETGLILNISKRTVDYHLFNACAKLGVHSRRAAVVVAMEMGLFPDIRTLLPALPLHRAAADPARARVEIHSPAQRKAGQDRRSPCPR